MNIATTVLAILIYLIAAPLVGGLLAGVDRIISARMQGRYGPPLLQPFYDVLKLWQKENILVNRQQKVYVLSFFVFVLVAGGIMFGGGDLLLAVFALTLAGVFLVIAAYSTFSPYAHIGAEREMLQMVAYEPMVILTTVGMYMTTKSFSSFDIVQEESLLFLRLPFIFLGFLFILTIKFRKSPFDISMSHHAHQEIVRGLTTEFSGRDLALIEVAHWYENVFLLGLVYLFFAAVPAVAVTVTLATYFLEVFIDNNNARLKWQHALGSAWLVTLVLGVSNVILLAFR
ncbi:MAG: NADH-quinone oxidoreductase subunit H [Gracilibacteraceae bacterium]|jgi:formate hydrogenlyase subunit 4|nr:NADH-quinone oxidoreductase subunit H [Gracilibacteraceae bacterium]